MTSDMLARNSIRIPSRGMTREPRGRPETTITEAEDRLSLANIERRVLRACKTIRALPDKERKFLYRSLDCGMWSQAVEEWTAYGAETTAVKFRPEPFDVSDCLVALGWCRAIEKKEFSIVWERSLDKSFMFIASKRGWSDDTAERRYKRIIDTLSTQARRR